MKVLEVDTATCVIATLEDEETDHLATRIRGRGDERKLTSSSSRSIAESALMREPRSDSIEEDIFPAPRRSVGLRERHFVRRSKRRKKRVARTLMDQGIEWARYQG